MATPSYIGGYSTNNASATAITLNIHASATTGDLMIATVMSSENTNARLWDDDGGGGNGWTLHSQNRSTGGRDMETAIYWKFHDGSESNPTFTIGGTSEPNVGALLVYRDADTINPFREIRYSFQQDTPNPTALPVEVKDTDLVLLWQSATHDDITTTGGVSGYTARESVNVQPDDHMYLFTVDKAITADGTETPSAWTHTVSNSTPESQVYTIVIQGLQPIHLTDVDTDEILTNAQQNVVATGDGFEAVKGTGKVELVQNSDYTGTIILLSTDSWSDTSVTFDVSAGDLADTACYIAITNDSGDRAMISVVVGESYELYIRGLKPDHLYLFNNSYDDEINGSHATQSVVGSPTFETEPLCKTSTHSLQLNGLDDKRECPDSEWTNITNLLSERYIFAWVTFDRLHKLPVAFWEEGGGVNNFYFIIGFGNTLLANVADSSKFFKVQAFSNNKLTINRTYLVAMKFSDGDGDGEFVMDIDGIEQDITEGNPITATGGMSTHSGDRCIGKPDGALDTGDTDITYQGAIGTKIDYHGTFSDVGGGAPLTTTERKELFTRGAIPTLIISTDTEANMQIALDAIKDTVRGDVALAIEIEEVSGGGDFELTSDNITFNPRGSIDIRYTGSDELTWINKNGASIDAGKIVALNGTVVVQETTQLSFTVNDNLGDPLTGYEWRLYTVTAVGSLAGAVAIDGEETATVSSQSYGYIYSTSQVVAIQILTTIGDDFIEDVQYATLTANNQDVIINLDKDLNN